MTGTAVTGFRRTLCVATIVATAACGGSKSNDPSPIPGLSSTMTAKINGTQFTSIVTIGLRTPATTGLPNGTVGVTGTSKFTLPYTLLSVAVPGVVGTYQLSTSGGPVPQNAAVEDLVTATSGAVWNAGGALGGNGTITLSTLTATGASGEFSFTAVPLGTSGATGNKVVTEGKFNVTF